MAPLPARVRRKFQSIAPDTADPLKIGSGKWNDDLEIFLGTVCDALKDLDIGADKIAYFTDASHAALTTLTAFGRLMVAANDNAEARALLSALNIAGDTMTGDLNMGGFHKVTGLAAPSGASDAVRKADLDAVLAAVSGAMVFKDAWDASAGTFPGGGTAAKGWFYKVSVAGTVDGVSFSVGDDIYAVADNASTSIYAGNWLKVEGSITLAEVQAAIGFTFGSLASLSAVTASMISDASANGRSLITAANYAAMRTLLGLAAVATTGAYSDLTGKPTLGTAAAKDFGTGAGQLIEVQPGGKLPGLDASDLTNVPAGVLSKSFLSADQTITSGGALTIAHGMGVVPKIVQPFLKCVTAAAGYSVGDIIPVDNNLNNGSNNSAGQVITFDNTNIYIRFGSEAVAYNVLNKGTGATTNIAANSNFVFLIRAFG